MALWAGEAGRLRGPRDLDYGTDRGCRFGSPPTHARLHEGAPTRCGQPGRSTPSSGPRLVVEGGRAAHLPPSLRVAIRLVKRASP
jgi:hypothetical protein